MKRPGLKAGSKRTSIRLREKIKKKVREHGRKTRKLEKGKTKKQHVPAMAPFKDEVLNDAAEYQEQKRQKVLDKKLARNSKKEKRKANSIDDLIKNAESAQKSFDKKQLAKDQVKEDAYESDAKKAAWFRRELKHVVGRADVILQVLDSRDPNGCRCPQLEQQAIEAGKRVVLIMNKVDLVPKPVVKSWLEVLRRQLPTIAFKASTQKQRSNIGRSNNVKGSSAFGADELTKILGSFAKRRGIKTGITVGVVGFPNVGKSSVINSLTRSRACTVSAIAGSTRSTQEVAIDKAVRLLDCPGVLFGGSAEKQAMRGALSASALADPIDGAIALLDRCDNIQLSLHYTTQATTNPRAFLAQLAQKRGLVKKGGIPDCVAAARQLLQDCQRGKFSFYTKVPKTEDKAPEYLDIKLVNEMNKEFDIGDKDDWMANTDINAPTSGAAIGMRNDGFTELEEMEDDEEIEEEAEESGNEMEEGETEEMEPGENDQLEVNFPEKKKVRFLPEKSKVEKGNLRKLQKINKKQLKRKDKFETKLSDKIEQSLKLI